MQGGPHFFSVAYISDWYFLGGRVKYYQGVYARNSVSVATVKVSLSRASVFILAGAFVLNALMGQDFYKISVGPLYATELFIAIAFLFLFFSWLKSKVAVFDGYSAAYLMLMLGYLAKSYFDDRSLYWVARQSAICFYFLCYVIGYHFYSRFSYLCNRPVLYYFFGTIGVAVLFLRIMNPHMPEYPPFLFSVVGFSFFIVKVKKIIPCFFLTLLFSIFLYYATSHISFVATAWAIFMLAIILRYPGLVLVSPILIALSLMVLVLVSDGLTDANATWRYIYWSSVIVDSWNSGYFFLGKGFGVQYLPESAAEFERLLGQVSGVDNKEFQLMTVPTHNAILDMLVHLGLPGVLMLVYPFARAFLFVTKGEVGRYQRILFLVSTGMLFVGMGNQFLGVPYAAPYFWFFVGMMMASTRVAVLNYKVHSREA